MEGENLVRLKGYIKKPEFSIVGPYNSPFFKAVLAIPLNNETQYQHLRISSFDCAEALGSLEEGTSIYIIGHIEDKAFTVKCRHCGGYDKRNWFEVVVDNFKIEEEIYG